MAKGTISSFKIESWGTVEITEEAHRPGYGETTHKYYSVPTDIIRKFINAKKAPSLSDFESWIADWRTKRDAKNNNDTMAVCGSIDFWTSQD